MRLAAESEAPRERERGDVRMSVCSLYDVSILEDMSDLGFNPLGRGSYSEVWRVGPYVYKLGRFSILEWRTMRYLWVNPSEHVAKIYDMRPLTVLHSRDVIIGWVVSEYLPADLEEQSHRDRKPPLTWVDAHGTPFMALDTHAWNWASGKWIDYGVPVIRRWFSKKATPLNP